MSLPFGAHQSARPRLEQEVAIWDSRCGVLPSFISMGNSGLQKQNGLFVLLKSEYKLSFYTHIWLGSWAAGAQGVAL